MTSKLLSRLGGTWLALGSIAAHADYALNLQTPEDSVAREIYDLHTLILWVCVGIFVVVFGAMFYSIFKHRKSVGHQAAHFHENTTIEVIWTVIPFIILIAMAIPATKTVLAMRNTSNPDMTVKITGYQWKWEYDYTDSDAKGIHFFSTLATPRDQINNQMNKGQDYLLEVDNPLVVPTGKRIRVLVTANDVIHSWWLPVVGVKQDAIPGYIKDAWFQIDHPGTYRGQCAELCGKDHGFMPIVVIAKTPEDYAKWVAEQKAKNAPVEDANKVYTLDELKAKGEEVYVKNCAACHQANGAGIPGTFPAMNGSKIANGPKADHIDMVMNGSKKNPAMAAYGNQLSDMELAAVITYERNAWDNHTGDVIQPSEIKALRK